MRIRSTRPEFWRSERIASVEWDDRLVLKGLESYVDDNGVGKDDIALIVGDLFQRDLVREPSRTLARVSEAISRLHSAGLVWRYEADGTRLLFVSFWDEVQRVDKPQTGRFPRPDGTRNYKESVIRECLANPREDSRTFAPVTGEQGNRGTGEQSARSRVSEVTTDRARNRKRASEIPPRQTVIPDDWEPSDIHKSKARQLNVDLEREADQFTNHAKSTGRLAADWNAAFHNWLGRAKPRAGPDRTRREQNFLDAERLKDNPNQQVLQHFTTGQPQALEGPR